MPPIPLRLVRLHRTALRPLLASRPPATRHAAVRSLATRPPTPSSGPQGASPQAPTYGGDFTVPLLYVIRTVIGFLRSALIAGTLAGGLVGGGYGLAHYYVEHACLPGDDLPHGEDWEFALEREHWTGKRGQPHRGGGTDSRLGWSGRHLVRAAWMATHWGIGPPELFTDPKGDVDMFGFGVPAREWAYARAFLAAALGQAASRTKQLGEFPHSDAAQDLLARYAELLEMIGGRRFVLDARERWVELVQELASEGRAAEAARAGAKVGDVCRRLGEGGEGWWVWAVRTAAGEKLPLPVEHAAVDTPLDLPPLIDVDGPPYPHAHPAKSSSWWPWSSSPPPRRSWPSPPRTPPPPAPRPP
ncbi:hypothetical protein CALCODRAFT_144332 [Calocera cornea HHB12733]|uniref:Uncharacterized protein n=1 Tax=Calocera cornea HHB12733 TaxID=1353952 RepID=A0A165CSS0_9BASI|nr:hypothetical protein CALCODRAFT_144332 [Calocera cornea HHB12733]